jgi:uncharacterized DUF497 family protein
MLFFEWNPAKHLQNVLKHGISFDVAKNVFFDPLVLFKQDHVKNGEIRWRAIGRSHIDQFLVVAHVVREEDDREIIRIISARRALRHEISRYQERAFR